MQGFSKFVLAALAVSVASTEPAAACTRALYVAENGLVITGRTMDWVEDMHTNLWAFPRGIARDACRTPVQNGAAMSGRNAPPGMAGERPRKRLRTPPVLQMTCLYQHQVQWIIWLRRRHLQTRKTAVSDCGTYVLRLFNAVLR